jgi:RNA polymerase sigma factor (sigma-70 family)
MQSAAVAQGPPATARHHRRRSNVRRRNYSARQKRLRQTGDWLIVCAVGLLIVPATGCQVATVVETYDGEAALLRRAREGDERAFVELITPNRNAAWAVCLRITGNPHDAEDALQETLVAAWRNLDRFRSDSRFSTWLYRIASNAALAVVRRRPEVVDAEQAVSGRRDHADSIADAERVQQALLQLPEQFRVALVLRVYGDFTYDDIAAHQGVPVQTVKSRLSRARNLMQDLLGTTELA